MNYHIVEWALVFHIFGIVFWLGALLVVTHVMAADVEAEAVEPHQSMGSLERKLFRGVAHPGAAIAILSGVILIIENPHFLQAGWLHVKLLLVLVLIVLDWIAYRRSKSFHAGRIAVSRKQCMTLHGIVALVFIAILVLVFLKPF